VSGQSPRILLRHSRLANSCPAPPSFAVRPTFA